MSRADFLFQKRSALHSFISGKAIIAIAAAIRIRASREYLSKNSKLAKIKKVTNGKARLCRFGLPAILIIVALFNKNSVTYAKSDDKAPPIYPIFSIRRYVKKTDGIAVISEFFVISIGFS